mgnify:CR=1 FL=1
MPFGLQLPMPPAFPLESIKTRAFIPPTQDLLIEQATSRAMTLLEQHRLPLPSDANTQLARENLLSRRTAVTTLTVTLDTAVVRASFSNIPLWHALMDDMGIATGLMTRNKGLFAPAPVIVWARENEPKFLAVARKTMGHKQPGIAASSDAIAQEKGESGTSIFQASPMHVQSCFGMFLPLC